MNKRLHILVCCILSFVSLQAQTLLSENFNYPSGDTLAPFVPNKNWISFSGGTTNAPLVTGFGLSFTGYVGSGIGNAVSLTTSGQDVYRQFAIVDTSSGFPSVYASALVRVDTAQSAGDYFLAFLPSTSTTLLACRVFARRSSPNHYRVAITKTNEAANYTADSFEFGTTYLFVMKYKYVPMGNNNDSVFLYVSSSVPSVEPMFATAFGVNSIAGTDASNTARVALRQGTASNAARVVVDGIRVATSWANSPLPVEWGRVDAVASAKGNTITWTTISELNNSHFELEYSLDGEQFLIFARVSGNGNSSVAHTYEATHESQFAGIVFYRIKQVDMDGAYSYSHTIVVEPRLNEQKTELKPNPFQNELQIAIPQSYTQPTIISIVDMNGKTVYEQTLEPASLPDNKHTIFAEAFTPGIYFVKIVSGTSQQTQRIVKY